MEIKPKTFLIVVFSLLVIVPVAYISTMWYMMTREWRSGDEGYVYKQFYFKRQRILSELSSTLVVIQIIL